MVTAISKPSLAVCGAQFQVFFFGGGGGRTGACLQAGPWSFSFFQVYFTEVIMIYRIIVSRIQFHIFPSSG